MLWNDIRPKIYEGKAHINYFVNERPPGSMELLFQDLVGLGQSNHPFDMDSLGGDDPISDNCLCWQLIHTSHGSWCVDLDIMAGKEILYL